MTLLDECIEALGEHIQVFSGGRKRAYISRFETSFPFVEWGRIDWEKLSNYVEGNTFDDISSFLNLSVKDFEDDIYII